MELLKYLCAAAVAIGCLGVAATAEAEEICREVKVLGAHVITSCVDVAADPGLAEHTTTAPTARFSCSVWFGFMADPCEESDMAVSVGKTGFVPSPTPPPVTFDPATLTIVIGPGSVGTLWVNGNNTPVTIEQTCIGDPSIC